MTWWKEGRETRFQTFRLEQYCTVFQAELLALHRVIQMVQKTKEREVSIFSDSKSSLEMLASPTPPHRLALAAQRAMGVICAGGGSIRLHWVRAHIGTQGNERAD